MTADQTPGFPEPASSGGPPPPPGMGSGAPGAPVGPPPGWGTPPASAPGGAPAWTPSGGFPTKKPLSGAAVTSLVFSLVWVCGIGSLVAIVLGIIGIRGTKGGAKRGRGMAVAGLIIGVIGLLGAIGSIAAVSLSANQTFITQESEKNDVTITNCERSFGDLGQVDLEITNDSSKTSDYYILVSFRVGSSDISSSGDKVSRVDPGQTVTATIITTDVLPSGSEPRCSLSLVQRTASR